MELLLCLGDGAQYVCQMNNFLFDAKRPDQATWLGPIREVQEAVAFPWPTLDARWVRPPFSVRLRASMKNLQIGIIYLLMHVWCDALVEAPSLRPPFLRTHSHVTNRFFSCGPQMKSANTNHAKYGGKNRGSAHMCEKLLFVLCKWSSHCSWIRSAGRRSKFSAAIKNRKCEGSVAFCRPA